MRSRMVVLCTALVCLWSIGASAEDKKTEAPAKGEKGVITGVIAKIDGGKVTVKAGEKETVFIPYWRGGMPKDGGGFDKEMMKKLKEFKAGDKVKISWTMEEHKRIDSIEKAD